VNINFHVVEICVVELTKPYSLTCTKQNDWAEINSARSIQICGRCQTVWIHGSDRSRL